MLLFSVFFIFCSHGGTFTFTFTTILIDGAAFVILVRSINTFRVSIIITVFALGTEEWVRPRVLSIERVRLFVPPARPHSNCRWLKWAQWPLTIGQGKLGNESFSICIRFLFCDWPQPMAHNYVHKLASSSLKVLLSMNARVMPLNFWIFAVCRRLHVWMCIHVWCVEWANRNKYLAYMRRTKNVRIPTAKQRMREMKMWYFSLLLIHIIIRAM